MTGPDPLSLFTIVASLVAVAVNGWIIFQRKRERWRP